MLLVLLVLYITAVSANPFHKYPYVFLLDVGNEELEKVNTEQIRISKQGGSVALRYPAIGNGEDIAHVRVSGIDFGTDLKANIVDGGPGYKYVVLVLMGNPGVDFDAVITVQTVPNKKTNDDSLQNLDSSSNTDDQLPGDNDPNDSAEDLSEDDSSSSAEISRVSVTKNNAELMQESSNVYSYAVNEALSGYGDSVHSSENVEDERNGSNLRYDNDSDNESEQKDIHVSYRDDQNQGDESYVQFDSDDDYANDGNSAGINENKPQERVYNGDDYKSVIGDRNSYAYEDGNDEQIIPEKSNLYKEYKAFNQDLYDKNAAEESYYSQQGIPDDSDTVYDEPSINNSPLDLEEIFSDEYDYDDGNGKKYSDPNNNFIDRSDGSAVAY